MNNNKQCLSGNSFLFDNLTNYWTGSGKATWLFGDGDTSDIYNTSHKYFNSGKYNVVLKIISDLGCIDFDTQAVTVYSQPVADIILNDTVQCLRNNLFLFTDDSKISSDSVTTYLWEFGDGYFDTNRSTSHSYAKDTIFTVKYIVSSSKACKDSINRKIYLNSMPVAAFLVNDSVQCQNKYNFKFSNKTYIPNSLLNSYTWYFGDGIQLNLSDTTPASHIYLDSGIFKVQLMAVSNKGCSDTFEKNIKVKAEPIVNLGKDTILDANQTIMLNAGTGNDNYLWFDSSTNPQKLIDSSGVGIGKKTIWVLVSKNGCNTSDTIIITFKKGNGIFFDNEINSNFKIFPNPANEKLTIIFPNSISGKLNITNNLGQIQIKQNINNVSQLVIPISYLHEGIYFINITSPNLIGIRKFVKSN
jgi:PKD repeat protein